MRLDQVQDNWERLSREDPLWSICTDPVRRHHRWDKEEFFATGRQEIENVLHHIDSLGVTVNRGTALAITIRLPTYLCGYSIIFNNVFIWKY